MVCSKCQKLGKGVTNLATPSVKKKSEFYYGSAAATSSSSSKSGIGGGTATKSATLGQTGIGKSKLLSKSAKNPYAQYASACTRCKTRVAQGQTYCQKCAYQDNVCAGCGKKEKKKEKGASIVEGHKYTLK